MAGIRKVVILMFLCFCSYASETTVASRTPNQSSTLLVNANLVSTDKLREDLDFLFRTIEEVHPDMYAYRSKEQFALVKHELYKQVDHAMSISEFFLYVRAVVICLKDSHTRIERPSDFIMPHITESMREFGERLKKLVKPDYEDKQKPQDTAKGVDTVLQFTLDLIRDGKNMSDMKMVN